MSSHHTLVCHIADGPPPKKTTYGYHRSYVCSSGVSPNLASNLASNPSERLKKIQSAWVVRHQLPSLSLQKLVGQDVWSLLEDRYAKEEKAKEESKAKASKKATKSSEATTSSKAE